MPSLDRGSRTSPRFALVLAAVVLATAQLVGVSNLQATQPVGSGEVAIVSDNTYNDVCGSS